MGYPKILVALDRSELSGEVLKQAVALAQKESSQLMLFYCIPVDSKDLSIYPSFYGEASIGFSRVIQEHLEQQQREARQWLESFAQQVKEHGVECEWDWKVGEPGRWIRDMAKNWEADLVVLGRRGLKGLAEVFLGSVSSYVIHHVHCSVLVVQ
ncbi:MULTISPECIES: universal stress protein [unclassified Synechocystis]|uniref:universal stress protein n=1 Tax=unclassified Synechocystis TaxID=2640012 RepID=UPI000410A25E|nr:MULTISPECIES: universal stress protein [unclassified Synechocystis]AIE74386.1 Universal stress protein family [Synechocystis sp. PCC 6714]MCT0254840.1 universal stress protein [Synechocystis sp. CS-94]